MRAQVACLVELAAPNPGNVRPGADLPGLTASEMMTSAAAIGPAMSAAGEVPLGATILRAIRATREWVETNTNLGIVLLLAPPARAALTPPGAGPEDGGPSGESAGREDAPDEAGRRRSLWDRLEAVLEATTVEDAEMAFRAIRLAEPGGLGRVPDQDVSGPPTVPLRRAMGMAADRDAVAEQYATGYSLLRTVGVPTFRAARAEGLTREAAAHRCFVRLLAERPDSLIARMFGSDEAEALRRRAAGLLEAGPPEDPGPAESWGELDRELRSSAPPRNPGTTADLTAASVFLALLLEDDWTSPAGGP